MVRGTLDLENVDSWVIVLLSKPTIVSCVVCLPLSDIIEVYKEGRFIKKICFRARTKDGEKIYKFGVFGTGSWLEEIQDAIEDLKNQ